MENKRCTDCDIFHLNEDLLPDCYKTCPFKKKTKNSIQFWLNQKKDSKK
jgi:hypothetical protein